MRRRAEEKARSGRNTAAADGGDDDAGGGGAEEDIRAVLREVFAEVPGRLDRGWTDERMGWWRRRWASGGGHFHA